MSFPVLQCAFWVRSKITLWLVFFLGLMLVSCPRAPLEATAVIKVSLDNDTKQPPSRKAVFIDDTLEEVFIDDTLEETESNSQGKSAPLDEEPLAVFFNSLSSLKETKEGKVRILHYGDSHTAADYLTSAIRRKLQRKFGDGGRGFVLMGRPWKSYNPRDVRIGASDDWQTRRIKMGADPVIMDGRYGLGGVAVDSSSPEASAIIASLNNGFCDEISYFELFYLQQPGGGKLNLYIDGRFSETVDTAGVLDSGFHRLEVKPGAHSFEIRKVDGKKLRIFGAVVESRSGVVYDTLGINGAFTHTSTRWDATLLKQQIARRDPQLIVTMYGTNDAGLKKLTAQRYAKRLKDTLELLRSGAPYSSCLLMGPPDREMEEDSTEEPPSDENEPTRLDWIIETQRQVADEVGCAFLDTRDIMGGSGTHGDWVIKGLAKPDGVHYTVRGYTELGELLVNELLNSYNEFIKQRQEG